MARPRKENPTDDFPKWAVFVMATSLRHSLSLVMKTHGSRCLINHELVATLSLIVVYKHSPPSRVPFRGTY